MKATSWSTLINLVFRNLYSVVVFSAYCSILNNISKANRSNSLQSSHKTAPVFLIVIDNNDYDYNDCYRNDKCNTMLTATNNNLSVCVAERTRRHRHAACQQTGRERTVQEETHRPEPRVQEEHSRGEKIGYSQASTNTQPRVQRAPQFFWQSRLAPAFLGVCSPLHKCSRDYLPRGVDGTEMRARLPKIVPPLVSLKS